MPPRGVKLSCMPLTAPQLASVVMVAKRELGDAVAHLLALHVAGRGGRRAGLRRAVNHRMRLRLSPVNGRESGREKHEHRRQTAQPWPGEPVMRPSV